LDLSRVDERRNLLKVRLELLEAAASLGAPTRAERQAIETCRAAIEWTEERQLGQHAFIWGSGAIGRTFASYIALSMVGTVLLGPKAITFARALLAVLLAVPFALAGGAFLGWLSWRAHEREYAKELNRALGTEGRDPAAATRAPRGSDELLPPN
jgi:hypothetical protein